MIPNYDAIVIGGGIVGCACAYYLSEEHSRVALIEPGPIGGGATSAGMGHIVAMDDSEAQLELTSYSQRLWNEVAGELTPSCEWERRGTIWIASNDEEAQGLELKKATLERHGIRSEVWGPHQLAEAEPNLRPGLGGGLRVPDDSVVFPMPAAQWLLGEAFARGVERFETAAAEVFAGGIRLADTTKLVSPVVINAAGDVARDLTPGIPIEPRKGHLAITDRYPGFVNHQLVEMGYLKSAHQMETESVAFNAQPRATGQILIGSSRQFTGWEPAVEPQVLSKMLARAMEYMPRVGELSVIRTWTGFRAATPDKLPLIGPWRSGIWLAAGHEGLGITTSLATGKLLADQVAGRKPAIDPSPFLPERFKNE